MMAEVSKTKHAPGSGISISGETIASEGLQLVLTGVFVQVLALTVKQVSYFDGSMNSSAESRSAPNLIETPLFKRSSPPAVVTIPVSASVI